MNGIPQGAMEGGVVMFMDERAENCSLHFPHSPHPCGSVDICSCNIYTSAIHGGRIPQGAMEGGAVIALTLIKSYAYDHEKHTIK